MRETLGFEEFHEALLQLKEERDGVDPAERVFDLPDMTPESDNGDGWSHWRRRDDWRSWQRRWHDEEEEPGPEDEDRPNAADYEAVPGSEHLSEGGRASPSPVRSVHAERAAPSPARSQPAPSEKKSKAAVGQLGPMDTFILDVLRGWRLLVAASLSADEWRDVLATTNNKLDYLSVSDALQTLWDEQMGAGKWMGTPSQHQQFWAESASSTDQWWFEGQHAWSQWPGSDWQDDGGWQSDSWNAWSEVQAQQLADFPEHPEDEKDLELSEALEAEKAAEALAVEARRTWSQAQQATANLRRDRGFGKSNASSSTRGCFTCGGNHLQRDCPDLHHPSVRKGGGKSLSPAELDAYLANKGKGRWGKGKSKQGMAVEGDLDSSWQVPAWSHEQFAAFKGKGKFPKGKGKPSANLYGMDVYGLEMFPIEMMETTGCSVPPPRQSVVPPGYGMLDCGATASAGPGASVKKLILHLRGFDKDLNVSLNYEKRPYFR